MNLAWLSLTSTQYEKLERWAEGRFVLDEKPVPAEIQDIPLGDRPDALTRAALEPCVGGGFHPGIEMTYIAWDKGLYSEPFRFANTLKPGDITRYMAVPWQGDFWSCRIAWWPAQRPEDVVTQPSHPLRRGRDWLEEGPELECSGLDAPSSFGGEADHLALGDEVLQVSSQGDDAAESAGIEDPILV